MTPRSTFTFSAVDGFVLIEDRNKGMSVTNDAENVIAHIAGQVDLTGKRVLYRDSEGRWDELLVQDGRFAGFRLVGARGSWREAVEMANRAA
jgi:hypothetical protein